MKALTLRLFGFAALLAVAAPLFAQDQATLIAKKEKKMEGKWLTKAEWTTDYDKARAAATETGKPIFVYFTRSYAP